MKNSVLAVSGDICGLCCLSRPDVCRCLESNLEQRSDYLGSPHSLLLDVTVRTDLMRLNRLFCVWSVFWGIL